MPEWRYPAVAAAIAASGLLELVLVPGMSEDPVAAWSVVAVCVPAAAARQYPVPAALAEGLVLALGPSVAGGFPALPVLALAVTGYACGAHAGSRTGAAGVAALLALIFAGSAAAGVPSLLALVAPWWTGRQVRRRRELVDELAERTRELEEQEEAYARLRVQHEHARIARELHDIVAHHLAVIVVQAGAGRMTSGAGAERFAGIRQAGEEALAEMARLVDVLHGDEDGIRSRRSVRTLVEQAQASGLDVALTTSPGDLELAGPVGATAFRLVQEGLTNALKHAPGSTVEVSLRATGDTLHVEVRNGARATPSPLAATGSGLGLRGMRERVRALGGDLEAGAAGGGWRLRARLPLGAGHDAAPPVATAADRTPVG